MVAQRFVPGRVSDRWRYGLLGGLIAIPFTTFGYWQTGSKVSLGPVFLGGLVAGYLARQDIGDGRGVGLRTGLIGGLPALWMLIDMFGSSLELTGSWWFVGIGLAFVATFAIAVSLMALGLAAFIGEAGARIGSWLAELTGRQKPPVMG